MRLVDAITGRVSCIKQTDHQKINFETSPSGEKNVYRKRGTAAPQIGLPQSLPKRLHFVMDVSGSMYRFNGVDKRLERLLETTVTATQFCLTELCGNYAAPCYIRSSSWSRWLIFRTSTLTQSWAIQATVRHLHHLFERAHTPM